MPFSNRERVAHVLRRLGMTPYWELAASLATPDDALAKALELAKPLPVPPDLPVPTTKIEGKATIKEGMAWWFELMGSPHRMIEERLIWFWHDHFATGTRKVGYRWLMWLQHLTIRRHAVGRFPALLEAITEDPAMLIFLDGIENQVDAINENFGREVQELFALGVGHYTEADVIAAARAFSGWVVHLPPDPRMWQSELVPERHDAGVKTLLGVIGPHTSGDAIAIILDQPAATDHIARSVHVELVGYEPDDAEARRLAAALGRDWRIMDLVEAIVTGPVFLSDDAIRAKVRSPLERAMGIVHAFPRVDDWFTAAWGAMRNADYYLPLRPPNVGGLPAGDRLLGPNRLIHGFDLMAIVHPKKLPDMPAMEMFHRLGVWDVSATSLAVVEAEPDPIRRLALAVNAPEYAVV